MPSLCSTNETPLYRWATGAGGSVRRGMMFKAGAVRLGANESSYGPAPVVKEAIMSEIAAVHLYPFPSENLEADIAARLGLDSRNVLLGSGSNDLIYRIVTSLGGRSNEIVVPTPSFPLYEAAATATGAPLVAVPLGHDGAANLGAMLDAITPATSLVIVCNPNNPTGGHVGRASVANFLDAVPRDVVILLDEAYWEMTSAFARGIGDCAALTASHPNLIITRTFSKYYALAGLRVGYALASEALRKELAARSGPTMVNRLAISAARAALAAEPYYQEKAQEVRSERRRIFSVTEKLGLSPCVSETNFVTFHRPESGSVAVSMEAFLDRGFWLRPGESVGLPGQVRMTVGTPEQNDGVLEMLDEMVSGAVR